MRKSGWQLLFVSLILFLASCTTSKTYSVQIKYVPQTPPGLEDRELLVGVAPFTDRRGRDHDVGVREKLDGSLDQFVSAPPSVSEGVRRAVGKFLRAYSFKVADIEAWNGKVDSLPEIGTDLVVGGEIHRFWGQAESLAGRTVITADVALTIYLGEPQRRQVRSRTMEMTREITEVIFSPEKIEETLNENLSEMIEDIFEELLAGG